MRLNIVLSATGLIAGATASALTYSAIATTTTGAAITTRIGTNITALAIGAGVRLVVGPTTGEIVKRTIETTGATVITPTVESAGNTLAIATSAAVGALVVTAVSLLGYGAAYSYKSAIRLLRSRQIFEPIQASIVDDTGLDCWVIDTVPVEPHEPSVV